MNVIRVLLPPLRERREDLPWLAEHFLQKFSAEMGKDVLAMTPDALRALERYPFPGNVRELENLIERAVALSGGRTIGLGDLPPQVSGLAGAPTPNLGELPSEGCDSESVLGELERRLLLAALERSGGVRKHAAALLGVTFRSMRYRLKKHGLETDGDSVGDDEADSSRPGDGLASS
ncbi:MAG: helix-turn-helix domain-containing protein [Polyangiaceae bacterium]